MHHGVETVSRFVSNQSPKNSSRKPTTTICDSVLYSRRSTFRSEKFRAGGARYSQLRMKSGVRCTRSLNYSPNFERRSLWNVSDWQSSISD